MGNVYLNDQHGRPAALLASLAAAPFSWSLPGEVTKQGHHHHHHHHHHHQISGKLIQNSNSIQVWYIYVYLLYID